MKLTRVTFTISLIFLSGLLTACGDKPAEKAKPVVLEGENIVLARVNGSAITKYDLEQTIRKTLGRRSAGMLDESGRQKVLESLVASRAIAQVQELDLSPKDKAAIEKKVQAYRDELLVMRYLAKHAPPQPVTQEMVREYYESHPERFGGKTIRSYEMIASKRSLKAEERDALIKILSKPGEKKDWKKWIKKLQKQGYPVAFRRGEVSEKILHQKLRELMRPLKKGEASQLTFVKGMAYIVRIVDEKKIPPRPLREVSAEIRRSLAPVQLKKAVKKASDEVLGKAEVSYERSAIGSQRSAKKETTGKADR